MSQTLAQAHDRPWQARWIWHPPAEHMDNLHLLTRRVLECDRPPDSAVCRISACNMYELYVNGKFVGRGPSPSYPDWQYFDAYDIAPLLTAGRNIIAARCYNYGPTMQSVLLQDPGPGGLLVEIDSDRQTLLISDDQWRVMADPTRPRQTEQISGHRGGFKEIFDARAEVLGWEQIQFNDSDWSAAHVLGPADCQPWTRLIPGEIPPLRIEPVLPRDVFSHTCAETYGGKKYDVTDPHALRSGDDACATVEPVKAEFAPALILDYGEGVYGYLEIDIADSAGGTVEISYGESLNLTVVDRLIMRKGPQRYRTVTRRGGRYVMLSFRDCAGPVQVRRAVFHRQSYPVEFRGQFQCSDDLLNRIWQVGRYTTQMCMQDHFEDCPWREQTLYCGDLGVSALLADYAFGAPELTRKCLRQFARLQTDDGRIPTMGPAPRFMWCLPEYPAFWLISLWQHHRHWNDGELVGELFENVMRCMQWYEDRSSADGMFERRADENFGRFIDNLSNITAGQKLAAEQIIYCRALRCAADLADVLERTDVADQWRRRADRLAKTIVERFWSAERRCFVDGLTEDGQAVTQITNGLALLYGIVPDELRRDALAVLGDRAKAPPMRAGYMNFYMTEALIAEGRHDEALGRIREYWGGMIERGATTFWEVFDPDSPDGTLPQRMWSLCHAFCAGPVYTLPAHIAGIGALAPGFERAQIAPHLLDLHWVRATVPTPAGDIQLTALQHAHERTLDMTVTVPANVTAEIVAPLPGRDLAVVYLDGQPVPLQTDRQTLAVVHSRLTEVRTEPGALRLILSPSDGQTAFHITTRRQSPQGVRPVIAEEPFGHWDAAPRPVE